MIKFIEKPNLPEGNVRTVICGELCDELNDFLDKKGIARIIINPNDSIDSAVKFHVDMAVTHLGHNSILIDKNQRNVGSVLAEKGFMVYCTDEPVRGEYPRDIKLNFTIFGEHIMGKLSCADANLLSMSEEKVKIDVKQGYCKCSCLVIDENAFITDDESIYKVAIKKDVDCLLVSKGDVALPGHGYGFIGGASGKISKKEVLFFGDITKHRDYNKISEFINKYSCELIALDFPLTDFGGIVPLIED